MMAAVERDAILVDPLHVRHRRVVIFDRAMEFPLVEDFKDSGRRVPPRLAARDRRHGNERVALVQIDELVRQADDHPAGPVALRSGFHRNRPFFSRVWPHVRNICSRASAAALLALSLASIVSDPAQACSVGIAMASPPQIATASISLLICRLFLTNYFQDIQYLRRQVGSPSARDNGCYDLAVHVHHSHFAKNDRWRRGSVRPSPRRRRSHHPHNRS